MRNKGSLETDFLRTGKISLREIFPYSDERGHVNDVLIIHIVRVEVGTKGYLLSARILTESVHLSSAYGGLKVLRSSPRASHLAVFKKSVSSSTEK